MTLPAGLAAAIGLASERIAPHVRRTPVEPSPWLSRETGAEVYLKLDNLQLTGSFKIRGALNRILATSPSGREPGFVAASTGNHGLACAHAASLVGASITIFVPCSAAPAKVELLRQRGIHVESRGEDCLDAEAAAREFATSQGATYVSPYNDREVVAGQGTLGAELAEQVPDLDAVFIALGGGGLTTGAGTALKAARPDLELVACSAANSAVMAQSVAAGRILELDSEPTLSDGTAGGVEAASITFELCRQLVDRYPLVEESAIGAALGSFIDQHHSLIEGAAAVPIAALLESGRRYAGRRVAVVLCGANISPARLVEVLAGRTT